MRVYIPFGHGLVSLFHAAVGGTAGKFDIFSAQFVSVT